MKVVLRSMSDFTQVLHCWVYYGLIASAGLVLIQLVAGMLSGSEYPSFYELYRRELIYVFYASFGIRLSVVLMIYYQWKGFGHLLGPFSWIIFDPVFASQNAWSSGIAVSTLDRVGAFFTLAVYLICWIFLISSFVIYLSDRSNGSSNCRLKRGDCETKIDKQVPVHRIPPSLSLAQSWLLNIISAGLGIESVSLLWQNGHRWANLNLENAFLTLGYFYSHEFIIPVFINLMAAGLILKGWKNVSLWLPYLLIFLSYRAFTPPWEGWLPTPLYVVLVDRALVVLIMVNTLWTFLNWLNTRRGALGANG